MVATNQLKPIILVGFFLASLPLGGQEDWTLTRDSDGIKVYKRTIANSSRLAFRGVGEIDAPFGKVVQILLDVERTGEWASHYNEGKILRWIRRPLVSIKYTEAGMPLFIRNRDFISRSTITVHPKEKFIRVDFEKEESYSGPLKEGNIRGEISGSYFIVYSLDGGRRSKVDGVAFVDLKGIIPIWLINFFQSSWAYKTISKIRLQAKKTDIGEHPYFTNAFFETDPTDNPAQN